MNYNRCEICQNHLSELGRCKFCHFEYNEDYAPCRDDFDILNMDERDGWEHLQIRDRLHRKGIDCYCADIWYDKSVAYLLGCYREPNVIADALGLHEESVYCQTEHGLIILNLFKERYLRGEFDE